MGDFARTSAAFSVNSLDGIHTKACQRPATGAVAACVLGDRASTTILEWRGKELDDVEVALRAVSGAFSQADPVLLAKVGKEIGALEAERNAAKLANGKLKDARNKYDAAAQAILGDLRPQLGSS